MKQTWESLFIKNAKSAGHTDTYIKLCIEYRTKLQAKNLPVIFDIQHLEEIFEIKLNKYTDFSWAYKNYQVRKKSGGVRQISAPHSALKWCQEWVLKNILENLSSNLCANVHGFIKGRSIRTNAEPHMNKQWLINIDLKDFFSTIRHKQVLDFFISLGYVDEVASCLSNLCTLYDEVVGARVLPQGAPTSPMLANLIAANLDNDLVELAKEYGADYTRYADDLTFSGDDVSCPITISQIRKIISNNGFKINKSKTKIHYKGCRMEVTGLTVGNGVHVPKAYRKEVFRELHFAKKFGPEQQSARKDKGFYKEWLLGRIMYIRSIDKITGDKMLTIFNEINWMI